MEPAAAKMNRNEATIPSTRSGCVRVCVCVDVSAPKREVPLDAARADGTVPFGKRFDKKDPTPPVLTY